jgi:putative glutamine amidotransferase
MNFALTLNVGHRERYFDSVEHSYLFYLQSLGVVPILIPNAIEHLRSYIDALHIQGIILTGGNDVSPERYGQISLACKNVSEIRDQIEISLLQVAIEKSLPVLGICRGMQLINVFFGGSLIQDIQSEVQSAVNHAGSQHPIRISDVSVGQILGVTEFVVNSFHNQGVTINSLAPAVDVFAISVEDGLIEGIMHPDYPILGIQWHPERPNSSAEYDLSLIQNFLAGTFWRHRSS